ncbi:superoxide dismutase family protein [Nesterenkonia rhizosphaerae]
MSSSDLRTNTRSVTPGRSRSLLAGTAALALLLSACGGGGNDDGAPGTQGDEEATATETGAPGRTDDQQDPDAGAPAGDGEQFATADLADPVGNSVGTVTFSEVDAGVRVEAHVQDMTAGFRGFTIHETGLCEPQSANDWGYIGDFYSAGAHLPGAPAQEQGVVEGEDELESPTDWHTPEGDVPGYGGADTEGEQSIDHPDHAGDLPNLLINADRTGYLAVVTDRLSPELLLQEEGTAVIVHSAADHHGNVPARYAPYGPDQESRITGDSGDRAACGVVEESR